MKSVSINWWGGAELEGVGEAIFWDKPLCVLSALDAVFAMHPSNTTTIAKNNHGSSFSFTYSFYFLMGTIVLNCALQIEVREIGSRQ